jgi:hypothetical protein
MKNRARGENIYKIAGKGVNFEIPVQLNNLFY